MHTNEASLVDTDWLARNLDSPEIVVLDGTYHLPDAKRDARAEYQANHIPGAVFFDIDEVSDKSSALPHMFPDNRTMSDKTAALGIGNDHHLVVYDVYGLFSAARVWWMFKSFGHAKVSLLDGGLPKWIAEGRELSDKVSPRSPARYRAVLQRDRVLDYRQMLANVSTSSRQVLDARSKGRFSGEQAEVRPGLRSGHIPGSRNVPYTNLIDSKSKTLLPPERLGKVFADVGLDLQRPIVTTCGSGVTACALAFALERLGATSVAIYDGSWVEWGGRDDSPIETG